MTWFSRGTKNSLARSASGILLGSLSLAVAGCSDENAPMDALAGGANAAGASGGATTAGGNGGGAAGSGGGSTAGSPSADKTGSVAVSGRAFRSVGALSAQFKLQSGAACKQVNYGDCVLSDLCADSDSDTTYSSAGTVSLTSAEPLLDVSIDPDSSGVYQPANLNAGLVGGEILRVTATGEEVPAFSTDLQVPRLLVVDQPAPDASGMIKVPSSQNLVLSFSRGADRVRLQLLGGSSTKSLSCVGLSSSSTLIVEAAALEALGSGTELKAYTVGVVNALITGWDVKVGTVTDAITPDHKAAITIQIQ